MCLKSNGIDGFRRTSDVDELVETVTEICVCNMMSMKKKGCFLVAKRILLCIARNRAERIERIDFNMSLNHDLGLDGDDFDDFFKDINRSIRIDWTSFNFKEYFNEEGDLTLWRGLFLFCHLPLVLLSSILNQVLKLFRINIALNLAIDQVVLIKTRSHLP